ncbi:MAG: YccF domain-containing protein [Acidimicrobiia bacterium]
MQIVLNVIWLLIAGIELAVAYIVAGLIMMVTIVGIPFGVQAFKLAGYALWPFGRVVVKTRGTSVMGGFGNVVWIVLVGWWLALTHLVTGIILCLTIIGIPLGIANFKMMELALLPFGRDIVDRNSLATIPSDAHTVGG